MSEPTKLKTGDLVRLRSGGPIMTLGVAVKTHTSATAVPCHWFADGRLNDHHFYLGQLETVPAEEAKAEYQRILDEAKVVKELAAERQQELLKLSLQYPQPPRKKP